MPFARPRLEHRPLFRSRDADETRAFLDPFGLRFDPIVKRAIDYIEANLDAAIGLPEIVTASRVPGRTLIQHFRDFKGTSPMRYLRAARYEKARMALGRAEPEESITEIAARWGFGHLGRFSVEYRRRFGESPSKTLRRRHRPTGSKRR